MKKVAFFLTISLFFINQTRAQEGTRATNYNFTSFSTQKRAITPELESLTNKEFKSHPEYGILPYNAPCTDCIELLQKRDESHRYFVKRGTKGKTFYAQSSYGDQSFYDAEGVLRTIDPHLKPTGLTGVYKSLNQPSPVTINIPEKFTSLLNAGKELLINRNVSIYIKHTDGSVTPLGNPDWSDYTAGDDGIMVHNFYPGIDLELLTGRGSIETFYRINKPLKLSDGYLVIEDNMRIPQGFQYDYSYSEKTANGYTGTVFINDPAGNRYFYIDKSAAFDENNENDPKLELAYEISNSGAFHLYVPIDWMNNPSRSYPIIVDPLISVISTLPKPQITGSGYNVNCFQNGCSYNLDVAVPAATVVYDILFSFNYRTSPGCNLSAGAWDMTVGTCRSPYAAGTFHTCQIALAGLCIQQGTSCWAGPTENIKNCVPASQCLPYYMPFTLNFYRCTSPGAGCGFSCIFADTPWDMTVKGYYVTVNPSATTSSVSVCQGDSVNLTAVADSGVAPYTYKWYGDPGGNVLTGSTVRVSPPTTTTYTVTARDCAGIIDTLTDSATVTCLVTVIPNNKPGFTISQNPACPNNAVTMTGLGAGAPTDYDWLLPGSNLGVQNDMQVVNGVTYATAGTYNVILNYANGTCVFPDTQQLTVTNTILPIVSIGAAPNGAICPNDNVTFTATPGAGAGTGPTYQWYLNGSPIGGATGNTYATTTLTNGDVIEVQMTSNAACPQPNTVFSNSITMTVNGAIVPGVSISVSSNPICPGSTATFTAGTNNPGTAPDFQWYVNGIPVGSNSPTFSTSTLNNGDQVTVHMLHVNVTCAQPDSAVSNTITMTWSANIAPTVNIVANPAGPICPGDNVTFTATPTNGGNTPGYQWYLNGNPIAGATNATYATNTLAANDVIYVVLLNATGPCISPNTATSNSITITYNPFIAPTVNIVANPAGPICPGDNVTFTATPTNGGNTPGYQWYLNGNPIAGATNATYSSTTLAANDVIYVVLLNATGPCISPNTATSASITITNNPLIAPTVSIVANPAGPICSGQNVTFTATPTNGGSTPGYQWYLNGTAINGATNSTYSSTTLNNGDAIEVHLLNAVGPCISPNTAVSNSIVITYKTAVVPSVTITATPSGIVCDGQAVTFLAYVVNGGTSPTYQWYIAGLPVGINVNNYSTSFLKNGDIVTVVITSNDPCANPKTATSNQIIIQMYPPMTVVASGSTAICPGDPATLTAVAGGGIGPPYTYTWSNGAGNSSSVTVNPQSTTTYIVSATEGCSTPAKDQATVTVTPPPTPDFMYTPTEPTEYARTVFFTDKSIGATSWHWDFGDKKSPDDTSNIQNPQHNYSGVGTYTVTLVAKNAAGCVDSIWYILEVTEEYAYYIPNSFSPNGDGINDYFGPLGTHDLIYSMSIYNRWGEKVFETDNTSLPWDGRVRASGKVVAGVYVYKITFKDSRYTKDELVGSVTIVK